MNCIENSIIDIPFLPKLQYGCFGGIGRISVLGQYYTPTTIHEFHEKNLHYQFSKLFYTIKYGPMFKNFLWERVRRPKIEAKYHPDQLVRFMEEHPDWEQKLEEW